MVVVYGGFRFCWITRTQHEKVVDIKMYPSSRCTPHALLAVVRVVLP